MRLGLGTVQFGIDYGATNHHGRISETEIPEIVRLCKQHNITTLDSAEAYGEAESLIGKYFVRSDDTQWNIITKFRSIDGGLEDSDIEESLTQLLEESLNRMKVTSVDAVLLHNVDDLIGSSGDHWYQALSTIKDKGLCKKIGISVYDSKEIFTLTKRYALDIAQIPLNIFDQRILETGAFAALKEKGMEVHVRSAFLQGLLVDRKLRNPEQFQEFLPHLDSYFDDIEAAGISPISISLGFLKQVSGIDTIVVGTNNARQLKQLIDCFEADQPVKMEFRKYAWHGNEYLVDPRKWN